MEITEEQVCLDILTLITRYKLEMLRISEDLHLTQVQLSALYTLDRGGELAMGEVAHQLRCDPSNITGVVDRLAAQDLVVREESSHDRRTKTIRLTSKGKKVIETAMRMLPERLECGKLTQTECQVIHAAAQKLSVPEGAVKKR